MNLKIKNKKKPLIIRGGMTMTEVLVTIGIFSMIMVGVSQLFLKSWQNYNLVMHTNEASVAANRGSSELVNTIRRISNGADGGYPILTAGSFDLKVFSDIDKDEVVEKVHYYLNGTDLMVGISNPIAGTPVTYPNGDSTSSLVVKNIVNDSSHPLFYYYNGTNVLINNPASAINTIRMIEINLVVNRNEGDITIESYASLRNLSEYDTIE